MNGEISFGQWLRQRRKALDLTQEDLAERLGCSDTAIRKIEAGERRPSRQIAELLAECLGIAPEQRQALVQFARGTGTGTGSDPLTDPSRTSIHQAHTPPSGTVTFLFTDIEGSTRLWQHYPDEMKTALARHDTLLRGAIEAQGGYVFKTMGDAFCAAFPDASNALAAALSAQRAVHTHDWGAEGVGSLPVRMALDAGSVELREGDYFGLPLSRVSRLLSAGHGGQMLLSQTAHDLLRASLPSGVNLWDLGEHRLRDLQQTEQVFQLVAEGLPSEFPPLKTLDNRPTNLTAQPTVFVGRDRELEAARALLWRVGVRLLTLVGPPGIGKTRLGIEVASALLDDFTHGVFFVALAPISDPGLVVPTIAKTLGVKEVGDQPIMESLKGYLRDKQMLLVLDNFEQVVEAAPGVAELMSVAPKVKLLVTSREALHLRGEHEYPVPSLDLPDIRGLPPLDRLTQYEAVRLFIERAQAVKADFEVTNDNAPSVAEICVRLDGLPLAIELAAARIKILPAQALLARLIGKGRLKLLTGGAKDLPARQQTLRATIEWSHDLLSDIDKTLFRRMAAFIGGCTLEAAEVVCSINGDLDMGVDVLDGFTSLIDKSLLRQQEVSNGQPRFTMLETIHEYAREKLQESGEGDELRRQHARYFMGLAEEAEPQLVGAQQAKWLAWLEQEHDNMRAALRWARAEGGGEGSDAADAQTGLRLAGALWRFWYVHGYWNEGRHWLGEALAQTRTLATSARAKALDGAGSLASEQADYDAARPLYEESLAIRRQLGDKMGIATSLSNLGGNARQQGSYDTARPLLEEALVILREVDARRGIAITLDNLGTLAREQGNCDAARCLYEESLAIYRELGDKLGIADALNSLGNVARRPGSYDAARSLYEESLSIRRQLGDKMGVAGSLDNLATVAYEQGDYDGALPLFKESLEVRRELGDKLGIVDCLWGLGNMAALQGSLERAAHLWGVAEALRETIGVPLPVTDLPDYARNVATAHAQLDEAVWQAAWAEGRAMTMEQAIKYALDET